MNHTTLIHSKYAMILPALALTVPFVQANTEGYLTTSTAAGTSEVGPTAVYAGSTATAQDSITYRETARRRAQTVEAQTLLQEGRDAYRDEKYSLALEKYQAAWDRVPKAPATECLQRFIVQSIGDASIAVAIEYGKVGRYDDAEQLLLDVLAKDPGNRRAKQVLKELRDPVRHNPALTPAHVRDVSEVQRLLTLAYGYYDLGKFDEAYAEFDRVLQIDPYNTAARRGQEAVSTRRSRYYEAAYDSFRAQALAEVDAMWEPMRAQATPDIGLGGSDEAAQNVSDAQLTNMQNLDKIQISSVNFEDIGVEDTLDFLRNEARRAGIAVNFIFEGAAPVAADSSSSSDDDEMQDEESAEAPAAEIQEAVVTRLNVTNVTARQLLEMICQQAGCVLRFDDVGVVVSQTGGRERMFVLRTKVPRSFFAGGGDSGGSDDSDDIYADEEDTSSGGSTLGNPKSILENEHGVSFPKGAYASYARSTGVLTVYNTAANLDLVREAIQNVREQMPQMVKVSAKFVEVSQTNEEELSFDWVVNPFSISSNDTTYLGGVNGTSSTTPKLVENFVTNNNIAGWPVTHTPGLNAANDPISQGLMTGGLRSGTGALTANSMDSLVAAGSAAVSSTQSAAPGILSLSGIYDHGSYQMIMRGLSQKKGVDIMSAPSLIAQPGVDFESPSNSEQIFTANEEDDDGCAKIEVVRRFIYPIAYEAPQVPENSNGGNWGNEGGSQSLPVAAPSNPTDWAVENVGIMLRFKCQAPENDVITFDRFEIRVVNFDGFINYGSPIVAGMTVENGDGVGGVGGSQSVERVTLTENRIDMPIFSRRYISSNPCIYDGHTIAIGGLIEDNVQKVEDKVPVFGDLPLIGRFFRSNAESHVRKNLMIFVTAELIDPTGKPTRKRDTGTGDSPTAGTTSPSPLFPEDDGVAAP